MINPPKVKQKSKSFRV